MKLFKKLLPLLTPLILAGQSNDFTPLALTHKGKEYLAFPGEQGPMVLYLLTTVRPYQDLVESKALFLTNIEQQGSLRLSYATNQAPAKPPDHGGKIVGALVGVLFFGISIGLTISDLKSPNIGTYLGTGAGLGVLSFGIGLVIDLSRGFKLRAL